MATLCPIPPVGTIYAVILDASNEGRMQEAIQYYVCLTPVEQAYFQTQYPEVYRSFMGRVKEFLRLT